jgi:poly-gamma-glutamate synthesis protein (capsule biosynthesis protein)
MSETKTIFIAGDYCPINRIGQLSKEDRHFEIFGNILPYIQSADYSVINLECPLTNKISPISKTGPALYANDHCINSLKYAGINLVTLANNHISDQGYEGLKHTLHLCKENNINTVGAGLTKEDATKNFYCEIKNTKIAFLSFAENEWSTIYDNDFGANSLNPVDNYYSIIEAKKNSDCVIVIVHGGHETYNLPTVRMQKTYRFFVDIGADIVVGHHTHCISGFEYYKDRPIFYSLGNFIFDNGKSTQSQWNIGMAILFDITNINKISFKLLPFEQNLHTHGLKLLENIDEQKFWEEINQFNLWIADSHILEKKFNLFCESKKNIYCNYIEPYKSKYLHFLRKKGLFPSFWHRAKLSLLKNIIKTESHRDVLLYILSSKIKNKS